MSALYDFDRHDQQQQQAMNDYEDWQLAEKIVNRIAAHFLLDAPEMATAHELAYRALRDYRRNCNDDGMPW